MEKSAIILAGGFSRRLGRDKGLVELADKPLILHVLDRIYGIVDETVAVVSSEHQKIVFAPLLGRRARVVVDEREVQSPLVGATSGFKNARGEYSLLLPCDTPFVSSRVATLLLDLCIDKSAAIPRWPNGYIEPLQAAYRTKPALKATERALEEGKLDLGSTISHLSGIRYVSTTILQQVDPRLLTFFNINTPEDLKKAESMLR